MKRTIFIPSSALPSAVARAGSARVPLRRATASPSARPRCVASLRTRAEPARATAEPPSFPSCTWERPCRRSCASPPRAEATELRGQVRSQVQLGNEGKMKRAILLPRSRARKSVGDETRTPSHLPPPSYDGGYECVAARVSAGRRVFSSFPSCTWERPCRRSCASSPRAEATKLRGQVRSQVQLGNEGRGISPTQKNPPLPPSVPLPSSVRNSASR
jgi:hypothetical protein